MQSVYQSDDDSLVLQIIQILQQCHKPNDLRFVNDLFEITNEMILSSEVMNVPKRKRIIQECVFARQKILENHPNILKSRNKNFK